MSLSLIIRVPTLRASLFAAVSAVALSGCVSAVNEQFDTASVPKTGTASAENTEINDDQVASEQQVAVEEGASPASAAQSASQMPQSDNGNQMAGLTTQATGIAATQNSIFANGAAAQVADAAGSQGAMAPPAFVPLPSANPAVKSLYQQDLASQAAALDAKNAKLHAVEPMRTAEAVSPLLQQQVAAAHPAKVQEAQRVTPSAAAQVASGTSAKPQAASSGKAASGDEGTVTLAAFFAAAAKKRSTGGLNSASAVESLGEPAPNQMGIAFVGRSSMRETFDYEQEEDTPPPAGLMKLASLGSLSRVAPNGLRLQTESVNVACMKPELVRRIKAIETHYNRPVMVTSGFRPRVNNVRRGSLHHSCEAADVQVSGVSKWELAKFLRAQPDRGGVGTYCHTESVHLDIGDVRDWNWRCRAPQKKS